MKSNEYGILENGKTYIEENNISKRCQITINFIQNYFKLFGFISIALAIGLALIGSFWKNYSDSIKIIFTVISGSFLLSSFLFFLILLIVNSLYKKRH
jgi:polyferredoxin